ncbi:oxidoreductase [Paractinoplanes abujensis]|uniref:Fatty acid CoA ligase FadD9 n=1 Tax=Paractinoplanes abujensis TaxID=882441 RepID=A0A7W7G0Z9_9ACTN|nr:carboxylic acid reductase [Actinoplanes abujensis]MBB4693593.1 fatty acid CoA ligase FadD9 [Actinoplanes abujensis]GID21748.1 oxidoreductase [Actinoplanes abujensis]
MTRTDLVDPDRIALLTETDEQFAAARPDDRITEVVRRPSTPLQAVVAEVMTGYADRPAYGVRATEVVVDPQTGRTTRRLLPRFDTVSYGELWRRAGALAAAWHDDEREPIRPGDFVATLGSTGGDYATLEMAYVRLDVTGVPLSAGSSPAQLLPLLHETKPRMLAVSLEHLGTAAEILQAGTSVRRLVVFDHHADVDDERERIEAVREKLTGIVVETLTDVLERGRTRPVPAATATDEERLALVIYTSGTTGSPKGAAYPARLIAELWRGFFPERPGLPLIDVAYLPMSHLAGRAVLFSTLARGGTSFFVGRSDLSTLFEDFALARPTILMLVPRLVDVVHQRYQLMISDGIDEDAAKSTLREEVFGGRVLWSVCGSAPLAAELSAFVASVLGIRLSDGYASTEAGAVLFDGRVMREHVLDYRLEDVPELNYYGTDRPHPRGELLIRSATLIPGYYQQPGATAEVFTSDGYFRTGDIVAELAPDTLSYLDRRKNLLKLSQGEFVALSRLETVFATGPVIQQIYLYGNSERSYLLAVVVPTPEAAGDPERVTALVRDSLRRTGRAENLEAYEIPRDFLIETEPFSTDNGLMSAARKLMRPKLQQRYGARLEQRYAELAERETDELRRLRVTGRDHPVPGTVVTAARAILSSPADDLGLKDRFADLGGDSVSALRLSTLLSETYGFTVPVAEIISPVNDLGAVASFIERHLKPGRERPTPATVHGPAATELRAADLTLDKFLGPVSPAPPAAADPPRTVLLTGATGYLGRFLCLAWLRRLQPTGGRLVCLVRGSDDEAARARLDATFGDAGTEPGRTYRELAGTTLQVLAGDLGEDRFGLDTEVWQRLAADVDLIVHDAALVNHVLPYSQLFAPNVLGTAEVIRLAVSEQIKPVTYVSTIGVLTEASTEDGDPRVTDPVRPVDDGYAVGYANSKWASEVLLREAHDRFGLPVTIVRPGLLLAHSLHPGQVNVPDVFTRLLLSVVTTGLAPRSFRGHNTPAHYGGLPVDFVAGFVAGAAAGGSYNVTDPHVTETYLDTVVDRLVEAGRPITRIDDYGVWLSRFEAALRSQPMQQRQHSLLPLLQAFAAPGETLAIPTDRFRAAAGGAIPTMTAELITKYLDDLTLLGLIPPR